MRRMQWQRGMIAMASLLVVGASAAQQVPVTKDNRTIQVSAVGRASTEADAATVHIGFQVYGPDSETAYARGSKASNQIAAALSQSGVPKEAIESDTQSLAEPQPYEQNNVPPAQRTARAYRLQQSWTVKTAAKDASRVLDIAVKAGADASGQIDWLMVDQDALHSKATADAMVRARKNAEDIASGMRVKLGALIYASNDRPQTTDRIEQYAKLQSVMQTVEVKALAVNPRKIDDTATVYVVYAIE